MGVVKSEFSITCETGLQLGATSNSHQTSSADQQQQQQQQLSSITSSSLPSDDTTDCEGLTQCCPFTIGDKIKVIAITIDELESLKKGQRESKPHPVQFINKTGVIHGITENQDVIVQLDNSRIVWSFGSETRKKHGNFAVDDTVQVIDNLEVMKKLQIGHGEFVPEMRNFLGSKGIVVKVFTDGDLKITFDGGTWTLNPDCVINLTERLKQTGDMDTDIGGSGRFINSTTTSLSSDPSTCDKENQFPFSIGDRVKVISVNLEVFEAIQKGHWWNPRMAQCINKTGIVHSIIEKSVKVKFDDSGVYWVFNPEALVKHFIGDLVRVTDDESQLKRFQRKHINTQEMIKILGATGVVVDADNDGDLIINSSGKKWTLNPSCVMNLSEIERSKQSKIIKKSGVHTWKDWINELGVVDESSNESPSITSGNYRWTKTDEDSNHVHLIENIQLLESKLGQMVEANQLLNSKLNQMLEADTCGICFEHSRNIVFNCGHRACSRCANSLIYCHLCRSQIYQKINLY